jgi:broad specificity phosphatase PhoE
MKWYFIRHGEMAGDPHAYYAPPVSGCLSARGEEQAEALKKAMDSIVFDYVFASPLGRAAQTAQALTCAPGTAIHIREWLVEWRPSSVWRTGVSTRYEDMALRAESACPEQSWQTDAGEGTYEMAARIVPGFIADLDRIGVRAGHGGYLLNAAEEDNRHVAFVAHGGSLGLLLAFVLGIPMQPFPPISFKETGTAVVQLVKRADVWYPALVIPPPDISYV